MKGQQGTMTTAAPTGTLASLDEHYRPLVAGYLVALTGNRDAARQLAGELLAEVPAAARDRLPAGRQSSSVAADLLLTATERGLAYLRHARALQLAGVGGPAPVKYASHGSRASHAAPTQWLRDAFERFRPAHAAASGIPQVPVRTDQARGELASPTRRLDTRRRRDAARQADVRQTQAQSAPSHDQVRRRMMRAVLADIPPEGARCLALHLVAGLSTPEIAWMLGIPTEVAADGVASGVATLALRYDHALQLLGLSPSLFERPLPRAPEPRIVAASSSSSSYSGPPTLRHRAAALPTQQFPLSQRPRPPLPTLPRAALPTLPAPQRSSHPRIVPVVSPRLSHEEECTASGTSQRDLSGLRNPARTRPRFAASPYAPVRTSTASLAR